MLTTKWFLLTLTVTTFVLKSRGNDDSDGSLKFPQPKIWWAKYITPYLYTAGKLSERQVKYAGEAGFKSLISLAPVENNHTMGPETLPYTKTERYIASQWAGMHYDVINKGGDRWKSANVTQRFAEIMESSPRPVLLTCAHSYICTFHAIGYLALRTRDSEDFEPKVDSKTWIEIGAGKGMDFSSDEYFVSAIENITAEEVNVTNIQITPNVSNQQWYSKFWLMKPVYLNWYIAGQLQSNHFDHINEGDMHFNFIIMTRRDVTTHGKLTQEEVTLLNVADDTGTYVSGGRQTESRLLKSRINESQPCAYVDWDSELNYESENPLEFGDEIGFNATTMVEEIKVRLPKAPRQIYHTPFGLIGENYDKGTVSIKDWERHKAMWMGLEGNILVTGRDGTKALTVALLAAGTEHGQTSSWAVRRAEELGYFFVKTRPDIVALFEEVLGSGRNSEENSTEAP